MGSEIIPLGSVIDQTFWYKNGVTDETIILYDPDSGLMGFLTSNGSMWNKLMTENLFFFPFQEYQKTARMTHAAFSL